MRGKHQIQDGENCRGQFLPQRNGTKNKYRHLALSSWLLKPFAGKRDQDSLEKYQIPGPGQGKRKMRQEHLEVSEGKTELKGKTRKGAWSCVHRYDAGANLKEPMAKVGQFGQENILGL